MKLLVVCVGRLKDRPLETLISDYVQRSSKYLDLRIKEVKDQSRLMAAVPKHYRTVALDERGRQLSTSQLAKLLAGWMGSSLKGVAWLIGPAAGLDPDIRGAADDCIALSRLTFPHRIARLLLCEQLYRALTIIRSTPYHK
jgi:23S rRNA (pseudouridine1915-N3)-methyltransferase